MSQPGTSKVYVGGSVIYNTKKCKPLLLNDDDLYNSLTSNTKNTTSNTDNTGNSDKDNYIQSKFDWTAKTSVEFCKALGTDYAIAEGGAAGPTFRYDDMDSGFAVLSIAGKMNGDGGGGGSGGSGDDVGVLKQIVVHSTHANREENMKLFANAAANLMMDLLDEKEQQEVAKTKTKTKNDNEFENHPPKSSAIILDRATTLRTNEKVLKEMESHAKYIVVRKNEILVQSTTGTDLAMLTYDDVKGATNVQQTFLGLLSDESKTPIFGIDVLSDDSKLSSSSSFNDYHFVDTRTSAPLFPPLDNELALHIMAYANWQRRSRFCPLCGSPLSLIHGSTAQQCTNCKTLSWPRQDPSMIASITSRCGNHILLARSKRHPPKLHTVLAGFVEAGETFESAVARETWEETGIRIDEGSVQYIGSQPWPFPQSCMIAFNATADDSQTLNIDEDELVDAKWFHKDDVMKATMVDGAVMQHEVAKAVLEADPSLPLLVPPKRVIARTLIDTWLEKA
jgi:NAD+ diphosphatase